VNTDQQPLDVGAELAQARERRGLSLAELSRCTKLSVTTLQAIEDNGMRNLPGGIYTRGFLRAYAREVGCDPEDIVRKYRARYEVPEPHKAADQATVGTFACDSGQVHVAEIDAMERRHSWNVWIGRAAVLLLAGTLYVGFIRSDHPNGTTVARSAGKMATLRPQPVADRAARPEIRDAGAIDGERLTVREQDNSVSELRLDIQPRGLCWLSATADGERVIHRLIDLGQHAQIEAHDELVLRMGDAENCAFSINGAAARRLGASGQPVTLHITPHNYRDFVTVGQSIQ
jgi:cytoskeleton protein RodZ